MMMRKPSDCDREQLMGAVNFPELAMNALRRVLANGAHCRRPTGWLFSFGRCSGDTRAAEFRIGESRARDRSGLASADSTFPNSVKTIVENFAGVPAEVREKIVFGNADKLYDLGLN